MSFSDQINNIKNEKLKSQLMGLSQDYIARPSVDKVLILGNAIRVISKWRISSYVWRLIFCFLTLGIYPLIHLLWAFFSKKRANGIAKDYPLNCTKVPQYETESVFRSLTNEVGILANALNDVSSEVDDTESVDPSKQRASVPEEFSKSSPEVREDAPPLPSADQFNLLQELRPAAPPLFQTENCAALFLANGKKILQKEIIVDGITTYPLFILDAADQLVSRIDEKRKAVDYLQGQAKPVEMQCLHSTLTHINDQYVAQFILIKSLGDPPLQAENFSLELHVWDIVKGTYECKINLPILDREASNHVSCSTLDGILFVRVSQNHRDSTAHVFDFNYYDTTVKSFLYFEGEVNQVQIDEAIAIVDLKNTDTVFIPFRIRNRGVNTAGGYSSFKLEYFAGSKDQVICHWLDQIFDFRIQKWTYRRQFSVSLYTLNDDEISDILYRSEILYVGTSGGVLHIFSEIDTHIHTTIIKDEKKPNENNNNGIEEYIVDKEYRHLKLKDRRDVRNINISADGDYLVGVVDDGKLVFYSYLADLSKTKGMPVNNPAIAVGFDGDEIKIITKEGITTVNDFKQNLVPNPVEEALTK